MQRNQTTSRAAVELPKRIPEGPRAPLTPPPCQTPFEFAQRNVHIARELNEELRVLRSRLFGDDADPQDGNTELTLPLERLLSSANLELNTALEQIAAIHGRL